MKSHSEKKRWEQLYQLELLAGRVPKHMSFCAAEIVVNWRQRNHRDKENFRPDVVKPFADALVQGGWLADDTDEWFEVRGFRFAYPSEWPFHDPRLKGYMDITLEARY